MFDEQTSMFKPVRAFKKLDSSFSEIEFSKGELVACCHVLNKFEERWSRLDKKRIACCTRNSVFDCKDRSFSFKLHKLICGRAKLAWGNASLEHLFCKRQSDTTHNVWVRFCCTSYFEFLAKTSNDGFNRNLLIKQNRIKDHVASVFKERERCLTQIEWVRQ